MVRRGHGRLAAWKLHGSCRTIRKAIQARRGVAHDEALPPGRRLGGHLETGYRGEVAGLELAADRATLVGRTRRHCRRLGQVEVVDLVGLLARHRLVGPEGIEGLRLEQLHAPALPRRVDVLRLGEAQQVAVAGVDLVIARTDGRMSAVRLGFKQITMSGIAWLQ